MFNKKRKGFTLAETLITIGVIGVVSALTLPSVVVDYNKRIYVSQLQKMHNMVANALAMCMADEGIDDFVESRIVNVRGQYGNQNRINNTAGNFLRKYFNVKRDCGAGSNAHTCYQNATYKNLSKSQTGVNLPFYNRDEVYCVILESGQLLCMEPFERNSEPAVFTVDVNGPSQGPNVIGRDVFVFMANRKGKISPANWWGNDCIPTGSNYGYGCFSKIVDAGWKMEY